MVGHIKLIDGSWTFCVNLHKALIVKERKVEEAFSGVGEPQEGGGGVHLGGGGVPQELFPLCLLWLMQCKSSYLCRNDIDIDVLHIVHNVCEQSWSVCGLDNDLGVRAFGILYNLDGGFDGTPAEHQHWGVKNQGVTPSSINSKIVSGHKMGRSLDV